MRKRSTWALPYTVFLVLFVALPLVMVLIYAFTGRGGGVSLENFVRFLHSPEDLHTFVYSIEIALITTVLCLLLGYPAAWIMSNSNLNRRPSRKLAPLSRRKHAPQRNPLNLQIHVKWLRASKLPPIIQVKHKRLPIKHKRDVTLLKVTLSLRFQRPLQKRNQVGVVMVKNK